MWRSLEQWLCRSGMGDCGRRVIDVMTTVRSMDVVLPVKDRPEVRLSIVGKPESPKGELMFRMGMGLPTRSRMVKNVVDTG